MDVDVDVDVMMSGLVLFSLRFAVIFHYFFVYLAGHENACTSFL